MEKDELKAAKTAFENIKESIASATKLTYRDEGKQLSIGTDASDLGMGQPKQGVAIENIGEESVEIIEFASKALPESAKHGSATYRELLAMIFAIKKFGKFLIFTDHRALVYLFDKKQTSPLALRWIDYLANFDVEVVHRRGADNIVADTLSRSEMNKIMFYLFYLRET